MLRLARPWMGSLPPPTGGFDTAPERRMLVFLYAGEFENRDINAWCFDHADSLDLVPHVDALELVPHADGLNLVPYADGGCQI